MAYLAAIIDGEGMITLERTGNRRLNNVMGLSPRIVIANTNEAIIQHIANLFRSVGANPHIRSRQEQNGWKRCMWISVQGLSKCRKVLEAIKPFLVGKFAQAELALEFIRLRGDSQLAKGKPYGPAEMSILDRIRALNRRGVTETERYEADRAQRGCKVTVQPA